jgi:tRNA threonylcarbamoyl adenosine modification protein YeaZ
MLGLDTATPVTTVALVRVGDGTVQVLAERDWLDPRRHGEVLPGLIADVLDASHVAIADVGAIAVGVGPGAFTGLRVGVVTAQTLGLALGVPVHGVVTLDAIAFAGGRRSPFAVVTDARRREVFWAQYADSTRPATAPTVGTPAQAAEALDGLTVLATPGAPELPGINALPTAHPSAAATCAVAAAGAGVDPTPFYLRRPDVTPSAGPKSVLS